VIENHQTPRRLTLPELFTVAFHDGSDLRASQMKLGGPPRIEPLVARPEASRLSDRIAGKQLCAELSLDKPWVHAQWCGILRDGGNYLRQQLTLRSGDQPLPITQVRLLQLNDPGARVSGSVAGSPIVDSTTFFGFEHPLSRSQVNGEAVLAFLPRVLPLRPHQAIAYSAVIGVAPAGQMRRSFLNYIERERAHPYRTFLHYNTWYDLGEGQRYDEAAALNRIHSLGEELTKKRDVVLDSFLFDDGWDNTHSLWGFNSGLPHGFTRVGNAAAQYHFGIGVWLSPWGGYEKEKQKRIAFGTQAGYEIVKGGYALSGPRYYRAFEETCLRMIDKYRVNQFKFDGTGNANQVFPGSLFDSDFDAALHLIGRLRQQDPQIFVNLTTGTYPSPFWLLYADSIWRAGEDHSFVTGPGSWRQRWITYRDAQIYKNIVEGGPLFPLNSLMLHGIIYAQFAEHLSTDPGADFSAEVRDYFGAGTALQELYITPSLLSKDDWDVLAEGARWSRANAQVLRDTHWTGGDPALLQVYGWASWTPAKGIVVLRNPANHPQDFSLDLQTAFELPESAPRTYRAHSPWKSDAAAPAMPLRAGTPQRITLQPYQVLTLEMSPGSV
jgi:hypothetical protein